jgi:hypothetical protein
MAPLPSYTRYSIIYKEREIGRQESLLLLFLQEENLNLENLEKVAFFGSLHAEREKSAWGGGESQEEKYCSMKK